MPFETTAYYILYHSKQSPPVLCVISLILAMTGNFSFQQSHSENEGRGRCRKKKEKSDARKETEEETGKPTWGKDIARSREKPDRNQTNPSPLAGRQWPYKVLCCVRGTKSKQGRVFWGTSSEGSKHLWAITPTSKKFGRFVKCK